MFPVPPVHPLHHTSTWCLRHQGSQPPSHIVLIRKPLQSPKDLGKPHHLYLSPFRYAWGLISCRPSPCSPKDLIFRACKWKLQIVSAAVPSRILVSNSCLKDEWNPVSFVFTACAWSSLGSTPSWRAAKMSWRQSDFFKAACAWWLLHSHTQELVDYTAWSPGLTNSHILGQAQWFSVLRVGTIPQKTGATLW